MLKKIKKGCYKSCYFVEKSLILHPKTLYHCCIPVNGKFGSTDICNYYGGPLPIGLIDFSREKYRNMFSDMENNKEAHCFGCNYIEEKDWDDTNTFLFENIHFNTSLICNLNCNFCVQRHGNLESQRPYYSIEPIVKELIENKYLSPTGYVFWAGGEPMMLPEFEKSFEMMVEYGVKNEIATNSTIFSEAIYHGLKKRNVCLKTSIDCGTEETFLLLKGHNFFSKVIENLSIYASTGADVGAKYIISKDNIQEKDLNGFINIIRKHNISYIYVDINHNFSPDEITNEHIKAAAYIYSELKNDRNVEIGVHSMGNAPNFKKSVEQYSGNSQVDKVLCENLSSDKKEYKEEHPMASFFEEQISRLTPMTPDSLPQEKFEYCKIFTNRIEMLRHFPQGGVCIEVGTQTGNFAKQILNIVKPKQLHVVDLDYSNFDFEYFKTFIQSNNVIIHEGMSEKILNSFEDNFFDFIYIDADHAYDGVKKDLSISVNKIKNSGLIACNDYTIFSPLENFVYGVPKAVNETILNNNFIVKYFALDKWGYNDIVLSKK